MSTMQGNEKSTQSTTDRTPLLRSESAPVPTNYSTLPNITVATNTTPNRRGLWGFPSIGSTINPIPKVSSASAAGNAAATTAAAAAAAANEFDMTLLQSCCLCLEEKMVGVICGEGHFVCRDECFAPFVICSCEETYKLKQNTGRIVCPVPNCASQPWTSRAVREGLSGNPHALDLYTDTLVGLLSANEDIETGHGLALMPIQQSRVNRVGEMVCDALTLKCPNPSCRLALDPNPDGCCSMRCAKCGCYFCWLCFTLTGFDSSGSHNHVLRCAENPCPNNLFVPLDLLRPVHKRRRLEAIRRVFLNIEGNNWQTSEECSKAIDEVQRVIADSDITKMEIFESTTIAPPVVAVPLRRNEGGGGGGGGDAADDFYGAPQQNLWQNRILLARAVAAVFGMVVFVCIGLDFNTHDARVYHYSVNVYRASMTYICIWYGIVVLISVGSWIFTRRCDMDEATARLRTVLLILIFILMLFAIVALIIWEWEGLFFSSDFLLAHITGGSILGEEYWHTAKGGLIPYFSQAAHHICALVASLLVRIIVAVRYREDLLEVEKHFHLGVNTMVLLVLVLAIYKDFGGDLSAWWDNAAV